MSKPLFSLDKNMPQIMAVLNVTPDSFSDGGSYHNQQQLSVSKAVQRAEQMVAEGASIIDIGGESTRPNAQPVSLQQEMDRVLPVLEALKSIDAVLSLDSSQPELMLEAAKLGIGLINDVRALQQEGALAAAAATKLPICLMHMQGTPKSMQQNPNYQQLHHELLAFFKARISACEQAGIHRDKLLLDPGFGFGKTAQHNAMLLRDLTVFDELGLPLLVGMSRKSMISHLLGERSVDERLIPSVVLAAMAAERGAWIIRVHDVKQSYEAVMMAAAIMQARPVFE